MTHWNLVMQRHSGNWATDLAIAVKTASDGDTLYVRTEAQVELARRAVARLRPDLQLTIIVEKEQT